LIGETLGRYQIIEHLGRGGMAEVYKAYQPRLDRNVAIKVLHTFLAGEENFLARFQREAKAIAMLRHPNIVQVYDFDYDEEWDIYYMVMEFIGGPTLKVQLQDLAARKEQMPLDEAVRIAMALGKALDYAHQRGMIHRDIKPGNIMFTDDGQVVLTDFGIARMINLSGLTASGAIIGTPSYISPEQAMGRPGDERSDIYSLAIVFYQLITGDLPFDAETSMGIILKHISEPPPSPRALRPDLPEMVEQVLVRALAKDPAQRYQVVTDFTIDLQRAATGQTITLPPLKEAEIAPSLARTISGPPAQEQTPLPSSTPTPTPVPAPRQRRWVGWVVLGMALILLLGMAGVLASRDRLGSLLGSLGFLPTAVGTPTLNIAATQMAETVAALQATVGAPTSTPTPTSVPTATPTPTPDLTATAVAACVFDIEVVSDTPIRPVVLMPGQQFVKRWEIENIGTCTWPESVQLVFVSGEELEIVEEPEVEPLAPEETAEIEITLKAPADHDAYTSVWQLQDGEGNPIGGELEITYRVGPTLTPRPTATPTATPTPEFTSTPVERLSMSIPSLNECNSSKTKGQIGWAFGGGPSQEYRYFFSQIAPEYELPGPYQDVSRFPHVMTYFVTSGTLSWPIPEECGRGDVGWCEGRGYEIVWRKVYYTSDSCPE
jgi:serine/threonine protein kinase